MTQALTFREPDFNIAMLAAALYNGPVPPGLTVPGISPIFGVQTPVYSATPAPDPTLGTIFVPAAMTANVAVANPINSRKGHWLLMVWTENGTGGFTVTYTGANWRSVGIAAQTTTLSTVTIDLAINQDGTIWRVMRLVTGQTV